MELALESILYIILALIAFSIIVTLFNGFLTKATVEKKCDICDVKDKRDVVKYVLECRDNYENDSVCYILTFSENITLNIINDTLAYYGINVSIRGNTTKNISSVIIKKVGEGVVIYG